MAQVPLKYLSASKTPRTPIQGVSSPGSRLATADCRVPLVTELSEDTVVLDYRFVALTTLRIASMIS